MKPGMIRFLNLLLVIGALFIYQQYSITRAAEVAAYQREVEAAEKLQAAYDAMVAAAASEADNITAEQIWKDGSYEGIGTGFGGDIVVTVSIKNGRIENLELVSAEYEDYAYVKQAMSLMNEITRSQSVDIDTISGATFSSRGILDAAAAALEKATAEENGLSDEQDTTSVGEDGLSDEQDTTSVGEDGLSDERDTTSAEADEQLSDEQDIVVNGQKLVSDGLEDAH